MKRRFCLNGCSRRSLVPSVGGESVEFRDWVFLSVFGVLETSGKGVRSMSLSGKQPSKAIAWVVLKVGIYTDRGRRGGLGFKLKLVGNLRSSKKQSMNDMDDLCPFDLLHLLHCGEIVDGSVLDDRQEDEQEACPQVDVYSFNVRHLWH